MDEIDLNEFIDIIIRDKGGTYDDYNQLMDYVAYHETGPVHPDAPDQRMKADAVQVRGNATDGFTLDGTGRGLFMFESSVDGGGNLASNRLANILESEGIEKPQWLIDIWKGKKSVDASKLTEDQQKMLFLAYHRGHETADFSKIWSEEESMQEFWAKYHWGGTEDVEGHLDLFGKSMLAKDSTDALKAKEEELMLKQNSAPYLSDSNNVNKLPQAQDIIDSIFGTKDSSIVEEYKKGGVLQYHNGGVGPGHPHPQEDSDTTYFGNTFGGMLQSQNISSDRVPLQSISNQIQDYGFNQYMYYNKDTPYYYALDVEQKKLLKDAYYDGRFDPKNPYSSDPITRSIYGDAVKGYGIDGNATWMEESETALKGFVQAPAAIALETLTAPQALMVEGIAAAKGDDFDLSNAIPGKDITTRTNALETQQRVPSEVIGFENPEGFWENAANVTLDIFGDPVIVGGALKTPSIIKNLTKKSSSLVDDIVTKGKSAKTLEPNLKLAEVKPPVPTSSANINAYKAREIKNVVLKRKTYLLSDEYITKRAANTGESPNQIKAQIDVYLKELDNTTMGMYKEGDLGKNILGDYSSKGVRINKDMSYEQILETIDHEINHLLSPVQKANTSAIGNPHPNLLWKDKKTGKRLTEAEAQVHKAELDFDPNPKWEAFEKKFEVQQAKLYENYPAIKLESVGDEKFTKYLMKPQEQQVRMVRYGEILKKNGWDGTKKGLTNDIINKSIPFRSDGKMILGSADLPDDVLQLLANMKGINAGSPAWYAQIKKTLPYAWGMAPVAATTLQE